MHADAAGERGARRAWRLSVFAALLGLLSVLGIGAALANTRSGVQVTHDGAVYLGVAQNLSHGHGLTVPFTNRSDRYTPAQALSRYGKIPLEHFPPLYPAVLAVGTASGISADQSARVLSALLFAANLALVGILAVRIVGRKLWIIAITVVLLVLVGTEGRSLIDYAQPWYQLHSAALSEPMFLVLTMAGMLGLAAYLRTAQPKWLVMTAVCCALATLTRYVGVALVATVVITVLWWGRGKLSSRASTAALVGLVALAPAFSVVVVQRRAGGVSARAVGFHPPTDALRTVRNVLAGFLGVDRPRAAATLVVGALSLAWVALLFAIGSRRPWRQEAPAPTGIDELRVLAIHAPIYIVVVWMAHTFLDASTPLDGRLLAPVRAASYLLLFAGTAFILKERLGVPSLNRVGASIAIVVVLVASPGIAASARAIFGHHQSADWTAIRRVVRDVPHQTLIATNAPENLYLATGRPSIIVPLEHFPVTDQANRDFDSQVRQLGQLLYSHNGLLVLWSPSALAEPVPSAEQLARTIPLQLLRRTADLSVLRVAATRSDTTRPLAR